LIYDLIGETIGLSIWKNDDDYNNKNNWSSASAEIEFFSADQYQMWLNADGKADVMLVIDTKLS